MGSKEYVLGPSYVKDKEEQRRLYKDISTVDGEFVLTVEVGGVRESFARRLLDLMNDKERKL